MQAHDMRTLRGYFEANRLFLQDRDEINISLVNTFLGAAIWGFEQTSTEPLTIKGLSERIGLPYTTVSRHLRYLGDYERYGVPGMDLVKVDIWPVNRRQKTVELTPKGKALRDRILSALRAASE